jgi:hypothetical protein
MRYPTLLYVWWMRENVSLGYLLTCVQPKIHPCLSVNPLNLPSVNSISRYQRHDMVNQITVDLAIKTKEEVQPQSPLDPISPWPPPLPLETAKEEELSSKEIYGLIAVLGTYLAFGIYLIWALCPPAWLDAIGWTWYPSR